MGTTEGLLPGEGLGGEAEPGSPLSRARLMTSRPLCPQEELQLLILSPPPDLQTLGCDPFSGRCSCSHRPSLGLAPRPPAC